MLERFLILLYLLIGSVLAADLAFALTPPELPRVFIDTSYNPSSREPIRVSSSAGLQPAIDAALPGDVIELAAGMTFTGNFRLPQKAGAGWIEIRSASYRELPAPGNRVGPSHALLMPKIVSPNSAPAIETRTGAHHYRLVGLEITTTSQKLFSLVSLYAEDATSVGQLPTDIILDRCYIHGNSSGDIRRGVALNGVRNAVVDSYLSDFHERGQDSQAIMGWLGPGPYKIANNFLSGAGENVMFGGGDPELSGVVPSDIEIVQNHLFKPLAWKSFPWSVKNLFELKNARRVLVEGNIFENNWAASQNGFGILFTVRNQDGSAPWSVVEDVTFRFNIVRSSEQGLNLSGMDSNHPSQPTKRIQVRNNLWENIQGAVFQFLPDSGDLINGRDIAVEHNTSTGTYDMLAFVGDERGKFFSGFSFQNNLGPGGAYGFNGNDVGDGEIALTTFFQEWTFKGNVISGVRSSRYPAENFYPETIDEVRFVDSAAANFRLREDSPYKRRGTDGKDPGAEFEALVRLTGGVLGGTGGGTTTSTTTTSTTTSTTTVSSTVTSTTASTTTTLVDVERPDTTPPRLRNLRVSAVTSTSALLTWRTNEAADSQADYRVRGGVKKRLRSQTLVLSHSLRLTGLSPGRNYTFTVSSADFAGNYVRSEEKSFKTRKRRAR